MTKEKKPAINSLPAEKLNQIVLDIVDGRVFIDRYIKGNDREDTANLLRVIFIPLALAKIGVIDLISKEAGLLYEYYSESTGVGINGNPTFLSVKILNREDAKYVLKKCDQITAERNEMNKAILGIEKKNDDH